MVSVGKAVTVVRLMPGLLNSEVSLSELLAEVCDYIIGSLYWAREY